MIEYPPPYECLVWDYKHSDEKAIAKALDQVDWSFLFFNKNVHEQVSILNRTLINVFSNFIPNKLVTFNDKDPSWMTSDLRVKINWKNSNDKDYLKNGKTNYHYIKLQYAITEVSEAMSKGKDEYHRRLTQKLSDPSASSKTYWFILKRFYNGKKMPIIPPLLINNKMESEFKTKANYFNSFFTSKCTPFINNSTLPNSVQYVSAARLSSFSFNEEIILKIINALSINKVHGHDDI